MRAEKLDHVAIKVASIDRALPEYSKLGFRVTTRRRFPEVGIEIAFLELGGQRFELLESLDEASPIRSAPEGLHHLAFSCVELTRVFQEMQSDPRYSVLGPPFTGAHGNPVFLCRAKGSNTLFEMVGPRQAPAEEPEIWRW